MAVETLGSVPRARVAPWNHPVIRGWVFQIVVVGAVAFRNVPLLLWLFLFYKLISEAFPGPRQAIGTLWNSVFLSNRGLYFPVPLADPIHKWMGIALLLGIAGAWVLHRWAKKRQEQTGQPFPSILASIAPAPRPA